MANTMMNPKDIKFTQSTVHDTYSNYPLTIQEHVQGLKGPHPVYGVDDFPPIRVANINGEYHSIDNRRLWVLKNCGLKRVPVEVMTPTQEFYDKLSSRHGDGESVQIVNSTDSELIPQMLKYSKCPHHNEKGKMGWKVCSNNHPCHRDNCTSGNPCHSSHLDSACGCISKKYSSKAHSIHDRNERMKNAHRAAK